MKGLSGIISSIVLLLTKACSQVIDVAMSKGGRRNSHIRPDKELIRVLVRNMKIHMEE
jgi:hypothetical protein